MRRKKTGKAAPAVVIEPPAPAAKRGVKQVTQTKVERFIEEVQPTAEAAAAQPDEQEPEEMTDSELQEAELYNFLEELDTTQEWRVRVDKLPDFRRNGQWGRHATREFCADFNFNPATYLSDIQSLYGPGDYLLTLHQANSGQFVRRWRESIARPLDSAHLAVSTNGPIILPPQPQQPAVDPIESFISQAEKLHKLKTMLGWDKPDGQPSQTGQTGQTASQVKEKETPLEEKIITALLSAAVQNNDRDTLDTILKNYLGGNDEPTFGQILADLIKPLAPIFTQLLQRYMAAQAMQQQQQAAATLQAPAAAPGQPGQPGQPSVSTPQPQQQYTVAEVAWRRVVRRLAEDAELDMAPESGAFAVLDLCERFPDLAPIVEQLMDVPPTVVLDALVATLPEAARVKTMPSAEGYILKLQQAIREEIENHEPEPEIQTAAPNRQRTNHTASDSSALG